MEFFWWGIEGDEHLPFIFFPIKPYFLLIYVNNSDNITARCKNMINENAFENIFRNASYVLFKANCWSWTFVHCISTDYKIYSHSNRVSTDVSSLELLSFFKIYNCNIDEKYVNNQAMDCVNELFISSKFKFKTFLFKKYKNIKVQNGDWNPRGFICPGNHIQFTSHI